MNNSQSRPAGARLLNPRKQPSQARSTQTVETILEGAAHILEQRGLDAYTTNAIADRAGVSIGSLYQYFPTKDAVTVALIERELTDLVREATQALALPNRAAALRQLIEIAVRHQLRRPALAALLDVEQRRLAALMPSSGNATAMRVALASFLSAATLAPQLAASELMAIVSALTDAAGRRGAVEPAALADRIEGAVRGYLQSISIGQEPVSY
ncbi:TetR family transcriptional regulator [Pseudoduganella sp. FT26W]|uniref:TetR family transcriptional regulator n=1 Tax=Duganella aquatilis TaxID=2666082 RepID=A0A844D533_9BURK|nr:TetR/AcrR family transcriptional regulator [Duganella aquatilis]MRW87983.1 TetR family transcriptional regulator [Duganella aquatilis]